MLNKIKAIAKGVVSIFFNLEGATKTEQKVKSKKKKKHIFYREISIGGIKLLKINQRSFDYYRQNTKTNSHITGLEARKKLTRNVLMAKKIGKVTPEKQYYAYGNLIIHVIAGKITSIKNSSIRKPFRKNIDRYNQLNKILDIEDAKPKVYRPNLKKSEVA
jgi:hypothetical protein